MEALLTHRGRLSSFICKGQTIRFSTSPYLERYLKVIRWNKGYIVVEAKYSTEQESVEDYIDMLPILRHLLINPDEFLEDIVEVRIAYDN